MSYQTKSFHNEPKISTPGILYRGIYKQNGEHNRQIWGDRYHKGKFINKLLPRVKETETNLGNDNKKQRYNKQPTHKTAHLQTAQANARPKFAKELFSCQRILDTE